MRPYVSLAFFLLTTFARGADNRDAIKFFQDYLATCGTNEIRCVWLHQDDSEVGEVMTFSLQNYTVYTARDVYDWATQNAETRKLTDSQALSLEEMARKMPHSDQAIEFPRTVSVSTHFGGKVEIFHHNRRHSPPAILHLYDLGGGYFCDCKT